MTVQQNLPPASGTCKMFGEGDFGWKGFFFGKVLWAVVVPPVMAVAAYLYVGTVDVPLYVSKALAYALTPLAVLIGLVGFVFASEKTQDEQSSVSAGHLILWWISLWAFAATMATLIHIASGPWAKDRFTLGIAALLTAGAFATLPVLPTLKKLFEIPPPPVNRLARASIRVLRTLFAGILVGLIWWCFHAEWSNTTFNVGRYIGSAVFYVISAGFVILALEVVLGWRKLGPSRRNRIISEPTADNLNWTPCACQLFKRSCVLAVSVAVPAGLAFNAAVDPDLYKDFKHVSVYILVSMIAIEWFVLIAPLAHRHGQAFHDIAAKTVMVTNEHLQKHLRCMQEGHWGECAGEFTAAESSDCGCAGPKPTPENGPDTVEPE